MTDMMIVPVEVRSVDEPRRLATMVVCKYGETSRRLPVPERFCAGAFTKSVGLRGDRVVFTSRHTDGEGEIERGTAVARPVSWDTADPVELRATLKFFDTPEGWEMFTRARAREIDGGSVGFKPISERTAADGAREVTEAALHHVMLLSRTENMPAYDAPRLVEVRQGLPDITSLLSVSWDAALSEQGDVAAQIRDIGRRVGLG